MSSDSLRSSPLQEFDPIALARSTVVATLEVSARGRVLNANQKMCELLGVSSPLALTGRSLSGDLLADAEGWRAWQQAHMEGFSAAATLKLRRLDGGTVELAGDIHLWGKAGAESSTLSGLFIDVTQERRLRSAMARSARMEALASLTSGIAHDVNNLLTVLVGNLYLVGEEVRREPTLFKKVKAARDAAKRGSELTRRLLSFARGESAATNVIEPGKLIQALAPLLRRALGRNVVLETRVDEGAGTVRASAAELESAVVNLAINARDAVDSGGVVAITLANLRLDGEEARLRAVPPGEYLLLSVADDGVGIAAENLKRIFEPFYSTKKERGGTGLGMSMVRWFAEQAGGGVHVASEPGEGTTVTMLLPRVADRLAETGSKTMPLFALPSGVENVLVLAADEALRVTMLEMLQMLGYSARLSKAPEEMFDCLHTEQVDLLIIDASADGGLSVPILLRRAEALKPGVKAIVAASGAEPFVARRDQPASLLLKPFSLFDFATAVRRTLDGAKHVR